MSRVILSRPMVRLVFFIERWLLSVLFLFLAWEYVDILRLMIRVSHSRDLLMPADILARDAGFSDGVHFEDYARYILLASSNAVCGLLLLISRRPDHFPTRAREIVVPLAATFSYMIFNQHVEMPAWMTTPFVPDFLTTPLAAAGVVLSVFGVLYSLYAILWLGRSLGIVVSVRRVVLAGPYRYVRHPIYFGYLFILAGMFLTACTFRMGIIVVGAVALLVWRARLEEELLAAHSPAYREWMRHVAFFFPRLRPAPEEIATAEAH